MVSFESWNIPIYETEKRSLYIVLLPRGEALKFPW